MNVVPARRRLACASGLWLLFSLALVHAQSDPEAGLPPLVAFDAEDYEAHPQVWAAAQDTRGILYFGNAHGVLRYDGTRWDVLPVDQGALVRALAVDARGRVFVAAEEEIGYLAIDAQGQEVYRSLTPHLPADAPSLGRITGLVSQPDGVWFAAPTALFRWDGTRFHILRAETAFGAPSQLGARVFVTERTRGLVELRGGTLHPVPGAEALPAVGNHHVLAAEGDALLIANAAGLFRLRQGRVTAVEGPASAYVQAHGLKDARPLPDGRYALATNRGVVVVEGDGQIALRLDEQSGLPNSIIYSLFGDRDGGLWLCHATGVVRADFASPVTVFDVRNGLPGTADDVVRWRGALHVTTDRGLFRLRPADATGNARFEAVLPFPVDDPRDLLAVGDRLLMGSQSGLWDLSGPTPQRLTPAYTYVLLPSQRHPGLVYAGLNDGLLLLWQTPTGWRLDGRVAGVTDPIRGLYEDADGYLWLGTYRPTMQRIDLRAEVRLDANVETFTADDGLVFGGNLPFATPRGVRFGSMERLNRFDATRRRFVPDTTFGFATRGVIRFTDDGAGHAYLFVADTDLTDADVGRLSAQPDGSFTWTGGLPYPFAPLLAWALYPEPDGTLWMAGTSRTLRRRAAAQHLAPPPFPVFLHRITLGRDSLLFGGTFAGPDSGAVAAQPEDAVRVLPHTATALRFRFGALRPGLDVRFRYWLEGQDEGWSDWTDETQKDYTNLAPGRYRFRVQALDPYGTLSDEASYAFVLAPPWYGTWWARLAALVAFVALVAWAARQGPGLVRRMLARLPRKQLISHYRLDHLLGSGGAGQVWRARDLTARGDAPREVAVKLLHEHVLGGSSGTGTQSDGRQRLRREAELLASFEHPHIVRVFEGGFWQETPYLAMELLHGPTLRTYVRQHGPLAPAAAVRCFAALADALDAIHTAGVVHRDLKSDNVMLVPQATSRPGGDGYADVDLPFRPVLMDFGLARSALLSTITQLGALLGTLGYMAPEQAMGLRAADVRSDLFSFGAMLYEALTGRLPFRADNEIALLHALFSQEPEPPAALNPEVPAWLSDLVLHCLAKEPERRPASARAVADALRTGWV